MTTPHKDSNFENARDRLSVRPEKGGNGTTRYHSEEFLAGSNWARTFTLAECSEEIARLKKAYEELSEDNIGRINDYLHISKANEEWSRRDHVTFGKLLIERDELQSKLAAAEDEVLELKSARDKSAKLICADCGAALARF